MSQLLTQIADEVDATERTLRRAVSEGTIRAWRSGPYALHLDETERRYLRTHWSILGALRRALRTEPGVEAAVLFGSVARGDDTPGSDLDVLVWLRAATPNATLDLERRLSQRVGRPVDVLDIRDVHDHALLVESVLRDGRVLVDRASRWSELGAQKTRVARHARRERRDLARRAGDARAFFAERAAQAQA